jgi:hypothetical protein
MRNDKTKELREQGMESMEENISRNRAIALKRLEEMKELEKSMELERCFYDKEQRVIRSIYKPKLK